MLKIVTLIGALCIYQSKAHFLQCSPSDSLESLDDLQDPDYASKQGVTCEKWPFYSGGFAKHGSHSSSSSSEESSEDNEGDSYSLLPESVTSDSKLYGFDDEVETYQCLESNDNFCSKWVKTKKEYEEKEGGCGGGHDEDSSIITEYEICLCADDNYGDSDGDNMLNIPSTTDIAPGSYCSVWACLETPTYPANYGAFSLIMDNEFIISSSDSSDSSSSSSSSSESSEDGESEDDEKFNGDYYRFASNGVIMELDESMEFRNCWCKSSSLNGEYCLNWYCESLEHDEFGCHKQGFGPTEYGWFGCYNDAESVDITSCDEWYGFLIDDEDRDEYRCQCIDSDDCLSWICGVNEMPLRRNYMWYNFWLALILWGCCCGCFGTKMCFKAKCKSCFKCFQCRKCRLITFYILFSFISLIHGGIPAFLFFIMISLCSLCCAYKCENCKCCSSKCGMMKKWEMKCHSKCDPKIINTSDGQTMTNKDGENSEESQSEEKVTKSGHIRVNSIDLDEFDGDINVEAEATNV